MGFFSTVQSPLEFQDRNSWFSRAESAADFWRSPGRWVASDLFGGGRKYSIEICDNENGYSVEKIKTPLITGYKKVIRIAMGLLLSIPGHLIALPFMGFAFMNSDIRLKHKIVSKKILTPDEQKRLKELIEKQKLEKLGCEPASCAVGLLCCITCLLCCLVCK